MTNPPLNQQSNTISQTPIAPALPSNQMVNPPVPVLQNPVASNVAASKAQKKDSEPKTS